MEFRFGARFSHQWKLQRCLKLFFISYHAKDRSIADYLQAAIREAGKSRGRRTLRLFWDDTSELAAPDFWLGLGRVLARCKFFILLASPEAAASSWVNEQLKHWLKHKSIDTVLIGITAGELAWNETIGDFVAGVSNPLPPALGRSSGQNLKL